MAIKLIWNDGPVEDPDDKGLDAFERKLARLWSEGDVLNAWIEAESRIWDNAQRLARTYAADPASIVNTMIDRFTQFREQKIEAEKVAHEMRLFFEAIET